MKELGYELGFAEEERGVESSCFALPSLPFALRAFYPFPWPLSLRSLSIRFDFPLDFPSFSSPLSTTSFLCPLCSRLQLIGVVVCTPERVEQLAPLVLRHCTAP